MNEPIFLTPFFQERIWGGTRLRTRFGYDIPSNKTGECWAVSTHSNGQNVVRSGPFMGKTLDELWRKRRALFGNLEGKAFPLLTKIIDANHDLSVQVHPNNDYARRYENEEFGKTECWYVIDADQDAEIVLGHTAQTKQQFISMIKHGEWNELLCRVKVKPGDFFYVPSGTIHALCSGVLILETQQSSDTTYRVYDYDRVDSQAQRRDLHIEKSIDVTTIPHEDFSVKPHIENITGGVVTTFLENEHFSVFKWDITGLAKFNQDKPFLIGSIIKGEGKIIVNERGFKVKNGEHFLIPNNIDQFSVKGEIELIVSHP